MDEPVLIDGDKNHNPRKGTEILFGRLVRVISPTCDKNHNPRKGTEILHYIDINTPDTDADKNHNPRKGTEITLARLYVPNIPGK